MQGSLRVMGCNELWNNKFVMCYIRGTWHGGDISVSGTNRILSGSGLFYFIFIFFIIIKIVFLVVLIIYEIKNKISLIFINSNVSDLDGLSSTCIFIKIFILKLHVFFSIYFMIYIYFTKSREMDQLQWFDWFYQNNLHHITSKERTWNNRFKELSQTILNILQIILFIYIFILFLLWDISNSNRLYILIKWIDYKFIRKSVTTNKSHKRMFVM